MGLFSSSVASTMAAQESQLKDIGATLLGDIDRQLRVHVEQQQATIGAVLTRFCDPNEGQLTQRLSAFVDDHGVLARLLEEFLGPQTGCERRELSAEPAGARDASSASGCARSS